MYPDMVHCILGNRDVNKLRLVYELSACMVSQDSNVYWTTNDVSIQTGTGSVVNRLKWVRILSS
jgi:hypothetical protein